MLGRCWSVTCRGRGNIWWSWSVTFPWQVHTPRTIPLSQLPRAGARNFRTYTYFSWYTNVIMFVYRKFFELDFFWQLEYWQWQMVKGSRDIWKKDERRRILHALGWCEIWHLGALVFVGEINFSPRPRAPFFSATRKSGASWSCQRQMCRFWTWNSSALETRRNKKKIW